MNFKVLFAFAVAVLAACNKNNGDDSNNKSFELTKEQRASIDIEEAKMLPLEGELRLNGKVIPDENNLVNIYPMVGGKVTMVDVEIGELVDTRKTLVIINSGEAREFEKEYLVAKDEYELAKKNYDIQLELFKTKFSSERELHVGETGLFSRHHLPFRKFDPRCRTIQSIHRSTNAHIGFDLLFADKTVFSAFIFDSIGQIATHCDSRSVRKSKTYLLHCKILI